MHTLDRLLTTGRLLWATSPPWKWTVVGGSVLTALVAINSMSGGGPSPPSRPPPPAPLNNTPAASYSPSQINTGPITPIAANPASDQRLSDYQIAHDAAMSVQELGLRCERMAVAISKLTDLDVKRAQSIPARALAVNDGENCRTQNEVSDRNFNRLAVAIAAAQRDENPQTIRDVIDALNALDGFDQSRSRYKTDTVKARTYVGMLDASDNRIRQLVAATDGFSGDQSPASYVTVADAARQLTPLDRSRLTDTQQAASRMADGIATTVREARNRFFPLPELLGAAENNASPTAGEDLVAAVAKISTLDAAVATPDQRQLFERAKSVAIPLGWSVFHTRVTAFEASPTATNAEGVANLYGILKSAGTEGLNDDQRSLLDKGAVAASQIVTSDAHLKSLNAAAADWDSHGREAGDAVLAAERQISPFDKSRFRDQHQAAWNEVSAADAILRGRERGLTSETKGHVAIYVFSSGAGELNQKVAEALAGSLREAGFQIADAPKSAALTVDVVILSVDTPARDLSQMILAWKTSAHLTVKAVWTGDNSLLFNNKVDAAASNNDEGGVKRDALRASIASITKQFEAAAQK